jgi:hypothetical protein
VYLAFSVVLAKDSGVSPSSLTTHLHLPLCEPGVDFQNGARRSTMVSHTAFLRRLRPAKW